MFASVDQNRLEWLSKNQTHLRASLYNGLQDAMGATDGDANLANVGQHVILPSSYIGGPRHMQQQFQDSMAIARFFQKVDLFITVTTNPKWPEITRELRTGETPYDRPDLVARVFQLKKKAILHDIISNGVMGKVAAYVYTIEFQKRGLPHMHLLVFLQGPDKLTSPEEIDKLISAQWPNPDTQPKLFATVKACMVHGPCGIANPRAPCMENGKCTKRYPKPFADATCLNDDGYPCYKRPNDGRAYEAAGYMVDNSWVVPYCPYLSAKYNCHINVECTVSLGTFRYVCKLNAKFQVYPTYFTNFVVMHSSISKKAVTWQLLSYMSAMKSSDGLMVAISQHLKLPGEYCTLKCMIGHQMLFACRFTFLDNIWLYMTHKKAFKQ